jgi:hypothetical protein
MISQQLELDLWTQPEQWRPVVGYEGFYEVSDQGGVRSIARTIPRPGKYGPLTTVRARILAQYMIGRSRRRYPAVTLHRDSKSRPRRIHRLILEAFIGPRPEGLEACHANDDPTDNRLENLRWDTRSANTYDSVRNGRHRWAHMAPEGNR